MRVCWLPRRLLSITKSLVTALCPLETGLLRRLHRVVSVSGGSIAAGALAVAWNELDFDENGVAADLLEKVGTPLLRLASKRVDIPAIALGFLPFVSAARLASATYDRVLFKKKTLQDLPESPRFSFTATSLQSGVFCGASPATMPLIGA